MNKETNWDRIPFSPSSFPFFYGWAIAVFAAIGLLMSLPGQTIGVSVYTDHLLEILGLNRVELSAAYMIGTVASSLALPRAGRLYDNLGARVMTPVAALGLAATLLVMSKLDRILTFFSTTSSIFPLLIILICFSFLRFFGQGLLTMLPRNMAMNWFVRRRGLINGALGLTVAIGFSSLAFLLNQLMDSQGFERALEIIAFIIGVCFFLIAMTFYRDSPLGSGLVPDGDNGKLYPNSIGGGELQDGATLAQAKQHFEFWMYCLATAFGALSITASNFHIVSVFSVAGYDRNTALAVYMPAAIISGFLTILLGILIDRKKLCLLLQLNCIGLLVFFCGLLLLETDTGYWLFVLGMGVTQATFGLLIGLSWPRLFGVLHLGEISGFVMAVAVFGSAIGPLLFGLSFHYFSSYYCAEVISSLIAIILVFGSLRVRI